MDDEVSERVRVEVEFAGLKVRPLRFERQGRWYKVERVAMQWERRDGGRRFLCFSVDTGGMMAELEWDLQNFQFSITNFQSIY